MNAVFYLDFTTEETECVSQNIKAKNIRISNRIN